jgi:hypothetical protein
MEEHLRHLSHLLSCQSRRPSGALSLETTTCAKEGGPIHKIPKNDKKYNKGAVFLSQKELSHSAKYISLLKQASSLTVILVANSQNEHPSQKFSREFQHDF